MNDLGIFYQDTRKFYEAEKAYKEALERREELVRKDSAYAADLAGTFNNLGNLYNDVSVYGGKKRFDEAEKMYKEALEIFESLSKENPEVFTPHVAGMLNNLGALYKDTQRYSEAEKFHKKSLSLRMNLADKNPEAYTQEVADSLTSLGIAYERGGKLVEAERVYKKAFEMYKKARLWFDAANACYNLSEVTANFSALETLRDPELLSLSWSRILPHSKLERAQNNVGFQKKLVESILKKQVPDVEFIPKKLPEDLLFIYIQALKDHLLFFVLEREGIQKFRCEKEFFSIGDKLLFNLRIQQWAAGRSHDLAYVTEKFEGLSEQWSETLPKEIRNKIQGKNHIVFSPDPYCSFLPLEALQIGSQLLCIEKTVARATSLHQFLTLLKRKPSFDSSLIVGNPWPECNERELIYSPPQNSEQFKFFFLDGAQEEAKFLLEKLPKPTLLLGNEATGEKFLSEVPQYSLVHFSGHGSLGRILLLSGPLNKFPPSFEPEEFSDLRKAEGDRGTERIDMMDERYPITDLDLLDIKITDGAIVFLNVCEIRHHNYARGGYYQGLPAVLLKNGAHSVISSLIPTFGEYSKGFATHFYETLLHTCSVATALKETRIYAKDKYEAQIYWVPYLHYGPHL